MENCCIIATARYEELYLDEWIEYHLKLGFDHIYICDNNNVGDELKINNEKVTVIPCNDVDFSTSIYESQKICYNRVIPIITNKYKYCAIIDVDEFIYLNCTLQEFIQKHFIENNYDCIKLPWVTYSDNNLIYHIDKPVQELYTQIQNKISFKWYSNHYSWPKSFFKIVENMKVDCHTVISPSNIRFFYTENDEAHIKHYRTKCLEDYIRQKCLLRNANTADFVLGSPIKAYFAINDINIDKLLAVVNLCKQYNLAINIPDRIWLLRLFEIHNPITVVIRTYNRLDLLKECINNVKNQTYKSKILVLNDGSLDETTKWLSDLDFDFMSFKNNLGPGEIFARGKHLITTPYYIILDDDDVWLYNYTMEILYNYIIDYPQSDLICTNIETLIHHGRCLVKTNLILECPNLYADTKDDVYIWWIMDNAKNIVLLDFNFLNYRMDKENTYHVDKLKSNIAILFRNFFKGYEYLEIVNYINNNYPTFSVKERKVCDQMITYINNISN